MPNGHGIHADPIEHVIVLMLENRSFDQMLGACQAIHGMLDGVPNDENPRENRDHLSNVFQQRPLPRQVIPDDPHHDLESVLRQIGADPPTPGHDPRKPAWRRLGGAVLKADIIGWSRKLLEPRRRTRERVMMAAPYEGHFVAEFSRSHPGASPESCQDIMDYYTLGRLPALHALAEHFTVCDRWYSSVPGPTWANRLFFHTGTSLGTTKMPQNSGAFRGYAVYDQPTLYDRLSDRGKHWRIYFHDIPQTLSLTRLWTRESKRHFSIIEDFYQHASGAADAFPGFVFIEPQYLGDEANDDHPPHNSMQAQELITKVYNAIRANEELWNSTLLVVLYDEHGGFYDHIEPPTARPPDRFLAEYAFDQLGVRVPALLISPWVDAGVLSNELDHTSVGKYISEKWQLQPLGKRMAAANSIGAALRGEREPRQGTLERIEIPLRVAQMARPALPAALNENQIALMALSEHLAPTRAHLRAPGEPPRYGAAAEVDAQEARVRTLEFLANNEAPA